jgi:hypothetical protein
MDSEMSGLVIHRGNNSAAKPPKEFLTRKEAALLLGSIGYPIAPATLAKYAANNNALGGPPYTRYRWKIVRYKREDLLAWATRETKLIK